MFGFFKGKSNPEAAPEGPVEIVATAEVNVSAETFFDLIDFAHPANAKIVLGHTLEATGPDRYALTMTFLPDLVFDLTVTERERPLRYVYHTPLPEGLGRLLFTREEYAIEPAGPSACTVRFTTYGQFEPWLSIDELREEVGRLSKGVQQSLVKLKELAEGNGARVAAFEAHQAA